MKEILWQISDRFELAPSSIDLAAFESQMSGIMDRENCLGTVLGQIQEEYDYVVVDCPPSVGLLTFNALRAATDVIVPVEMGYFSLHGLSKQLETLQVLSEQCRQKINVMVLASMYDIRTKMGREILAELRKHFGGRMFQTVVNFNTKLKEAASLGQPISEYDPASKGYKDFLNLAEELIGTDTLVHKAELVDTLEARIQTISASAEELLATIKEPQPEAPDAEVARPAAATAQTEPAKAQPQRTFEEKVADFYGVRQEDGSVVFSTLYPRAKRVEIAGDFNDWIPEQTPMQMAAENGKWVTKLPLGKGVYRYRLVVDGHWQQDPYNENAEPNPFGELNSVLHVK